MIWIEDVCSSLGTLGRFLNIGKGFFRVISEMLVGLMNFEKQSRISYEIFKSGRQGYFLIESRWTASHDM